MHFTGAKSSPWILLFLETQKLFSVHGRFYTYFLHLKGLRHSIQAFKTFFLKLLKKKYIHVCTDHCTHCIPKIQISVFFELSNFYYIEN